MNNIEILLLMWPLAWPILALITLGVVFSYLANSGLLYEYRYLGWLVLLADLAIFFSTAVKLSSAGGLGGAALFYLFFLGLLFASQRGPIVDLLILTFTPDRSDGLKLIKSYSKAERKIIEDDLGGSVAEYEHAVTEDPDDVEARLRLAEVLFKNADHEKSAEAYEEVLQRERKLSAERRSLILTRLANIHADKFGDKEKARELLQSIIDAYPETRFSEYAKERLAGL
jgi:tetratricopeptide (TPR) repeat protein